MDNSSPTQPSSSRPPGSAPFAYQTRILERTSSRASGSGLSRHGSQSSISLLTNNTGSSSGSAVPRRWTPSHRPASSMGVVRGRWEELSRSDSVSEDQRAPTPSSISREPARAKTPTPTSTGTSTGSSASSDSHFKHDRDRPLTPSSVGSTREPYTTPKHLKRQTMPAPIITSPLSPNSTGIMVEADSHLSMTPQRIHIPIHDSPTKEPSWKTEIAEARAKLSHKPSNSYSSPPSGRFEIPERKSVHTRNDTPEARPKSSHGSSYSPTRSQLDLSERKSIPLSSGSNTPSTSVHNRILRAQTLDSSAPQWTPTRPRSESSSRVNLSSPDTPKSISRVFSPEFTETSRNTQPSPSPTKPPTRRPLSVNGPIYSLDVTPPEKPPTSPAASSVMHPSPYRSSYMANKKAGTYGDVLSVTGRRKLGNHLPRIASGDADESWIAEAPVVVKKEPVVEKKPDEPRTRRLDRAARLLRERDGNLDFQKITPSAILTGDAGVTGLPGRISLKAPTLEAPSPSSRLLSGSWVDKQRHLLQAYEYLCHVGEAQQWIEGCLDEELGFGVVEMEDRLRNGVVLARLVRVFQGEASVKRIIEDTKRDFLYSDNINHFLNFLRNVGLPEGFIFELTDLYAKKNLPKVIYCIHALSHLLARRGMAHRIGNLLGQLEFSDDQLQQTQKGLKEAGVAMPNFGNVGRELAKEINEEPEEEQETEEERRQREAQEEAERRDRELLKNVESIKALQSQIRGHFARKRFAAFHARIRLAERNVVKLQTHLKGVLVRREVAAHRQACRSMVPWAIAFQARARGALLRRKWRAKLQALKYSARYIVKVQAQARGVMQRRRYKLLKAALQKISFPVKRLQAASRAHVLRRTQKEIKKEFHSPQITFSVQALLAHARGSLVRRRLRKQIYELDSMEDSVTALQAHCRGLLMRRMVRKQLKRLERLNVVALQAAVRTYLARKRLLQLIRGLRRATSAIVALQARARAKITRQKHESLRKALVNVQTVKSIGRLQALAKASLVRTQRQQLVKKLDVAMPDVIGIQAAARGALVRMEYYAWRDHLHRSEDVATFLQALLRGVMQRRAFRQKMEYYRANLSKVVKIQSLFRAKETREQYRQLTLGKNVTVGTIKNFVHLLDDSEADFQEEIKVERMRKQVVENIRENQSLDNDIHDLDTRIGLVVQNLKSFDDVVKARKRQGGESAAQHAARVSLLAAHGDPFSGPNTVDHDARRKLELYQQLFYLLQTRGEYLSRLFVCLSKEGTPESSRRFTEHVVLTLFGYGQDRREEFWLLKLFQLAIREEIQRAPSIESVISGQPMYINIAVQYVRARQVTYVREAFKGIILEVIDADDLDLEADPSAIHRARIDVEEMRSGKPSTQPKELSFREAVVDLGTRPIYIRHMQLLQWWTEAFMKAILMSTKKMSYNMRYLLRETLISLKETFPGYSDEVYGACLARLGFYRYLNPAFLAPELFDIVPKTVNITTAKKNLLQIARVLGQIASGVEFGDDQPSYIPVNDFVRKSISQLSAWFIELANVPDAETQFHAHEFMDATVQPKPIYISPNEIYTIHSLLLQNQAHLDSANDDTLKVILHELGGIPHLDNEELKDARDTAITLELTNRFATVQDPHAEEKTLWVQAKRGVLAILRVQPGADLFESLMRPVTENDEDLWDDIVDAEIENERSKHPRRQPSSAGPDAAYRLEDIRLLKFVEVKMAAIANLLKLEQMGRITRDDGFQGILNAIAGDVRSKHRKRLQRQQEMESMNEALRQLAQRKKYLLEQIDSYHSFVETSMSTMQKGKGKKRPVLPFSKQYFHLRDLQRTGQAPQFGSFLYSCKKLYDRGILLSIDQYSPRQFDKMQITMSSNHAGVFNLTLESNLLGVPARIASEDIRMEDLLQAKYEKRPSLALFGGKVKVNFELFLFQINKKFYA